MTPFCKNFCIAEKFSKKCNLKGFDFHKLKIMLFAVFQKNNQQCGLLFWNTWNSTKNITRCFEVRFHNYLLNLHDLHKLWKLKKNHVICCFSKETKKKTTHIVGYFFQTLEFPEKYFIGNEKHQIVCFDIFSFFEFCKKISKFQKISKKVHFWMTFPLMNFFCYESL